MDGERLQPDWNPPNDLNAERAALASMMLGDAAVQSQVRSTVCKTDFYLADHAIIFETACSILDDGAKLDSVQLRAALDNRKILAEVGGVEMIGSILDSVPSPAYGQHYANIVRDRSIKRQLITCGAECQRLANSPSRSEDADDLVSAMMVKLSKLAVLGRSATFWTIGDLLQGVTEQIETGGAPLVRCGIDAIDNATGGVGIGEMCIVAARPSMGKSTALRQIAVRAAKQGTPVGFISLEEGGMKIGRNILAAECGVENQKLRKGNLGKEEWDAILEGVGKLSGLPLYGSEVARRIQDIRALVTLWAAKYGVKLVILDYLQRVRGAAGKDKYEQVSNICGDLSDLWKEAGVAAVVAAQLNRQLESRSDKRPTMADLRDSGQIEQDADGIIFLHREDYYHLDDTDYSNTGVAEFIIGKWRDGVRGKVIKMQSDLRYQCFREMEAPDPFPPM